MYYILLTLSGTGIRISELKYITAEAVRAGQSEISLKGKNRKILLSRELREKLKEYMKCQGIRTGPVFKTKNGQNYEIDRNLPRLADILGHSSIETTRIYVAASVKEHEKILEKMHFM